MNSKILNFEKFYVILLFKSDSNNFLPIILIFSSWLNHMLLNFYMLSSLFYIVLNNIYYINRFQALAVCTILLIVLHNMYCNDDHS